MQRIYSLIVLSFLSSSQLCLAASCFLPDGSLQNTNVTYVCPTENTSQAAMCCRASDPSGLSGADKCVRAGSDPGSWLCQNDDGSLWRRGCSDKSWNSPGCVNICAGQVNDYHGNMQNQYDEPVTACNDGSFCCGPTDVGTNCCNLGQGLWIVNGTATKDKPKATQSSGVPGVTGVQPATLASTAAATVTVTAVSPDGSAAHESSPQAGVIAGSLIGGLVAGAAISLLAVCLLRKKQQQTSNEDNTTAAPANWTYPAGVQSPMSQASEVPVKFLMNAPPRVHEVGYSQPAELAGR